MSPPCFLRCDDVVEPGPGFDRAALLTERTGLPCVLSVIPLRADARLVDAVRELSRRTPAPLWVAQHGTDHRNRAPLGHNKDEFGDDADHLQRLAQGKNWLESHFADHFLNVYVPPWNRVTDKSRRLTRLAGFSEISTFALPSQAAPWDVTVEVQAQYRPPMLREAAELRALLTAYQGGGIMVHPVVMTDDEANLLADLLSDLPARRRGVSLPNS